MSKKRNQHVVPHAKGWAVMPEKGKRASSVSSRQKDAISRGRQIAKNQRVELVIHGRDGRIREKDSHGNDPYPPKG